MQNCTWPPAAAGHTDTALPAPHQTAVPKKQQQQQQNMHTSELATRGIDGNCSDCGLLDLLFTSCSSPNSRLRINSWIGSTSLKMSLSMVTITLSTVKSRVKRVQCHTLPRRHELLNLSTYCTHCKCMSVDLTARAINHRYPYKPGSPTVCWQLGIPPSWNSRRTSWRLLSLLRRGR